VDDVHHFSELYPEISVVVADARGQVLGSEGIEGVSNLSQLAALEVPPAPGTVAKLLSKQGCSGKSRTPARLLVTRAGTWGIVVACQRLDATFLRHASEPLGMGLALVDEAAGHVFLSHTPGFPLDAPPPRGETALHQKDGELWAVAHFCPSLFPDGGDCALDALSALPVGAVQRTLRQDFLFAILLLAAAGLGALLWGGRMAWSMTRALERLVGGFRELGQQKYTTIEPVPTGDELEELAIGFNQAVEGLKERDHLKTTFGKYMTESVMSHLMSHQVELGGDTLPVTILFSDIRGFTTISERLDAQDLVSLLNEYFTEMVDIVMDHGGVVDKYIGDAIMVVFGAPVPKEDDAIRAVQAAVKMREALARLNQRLEARGVSPIRTGVGIHSGDVVAGNIGSERRMEYTVIGDAVNLASRLESATKDLGADLVISEATHALVAHHVATELLGSISVKGREQPVAVYAVTDASAKNELLARGQSVLTGE
jgi:adenylate cyclase